MGAVENFINSIVTNTIQAATREKVSEINQRVRALRNMHGQIVELQGVLMQLIEEHKVCLATMPAHPTQGFVDFDTLETVRKEILAFVVKGVKRLSKDDDELAARMAELETAARQPKPKSDIARLEERLTKLEAANAQLVREQKDDRETISRLDNEVTGLTTTVTELSGTVDDQEEGVRLARAALECSR